MATTNTNFKVKNGLDAGGDISTTGQVNVNASAGDEGGQIFLNKAVTNTAINTGVNIDVYQNKLRFWEAGGTNRGFYVDITGGAAGAGTSLTGGSTGAMNYAQTEGAKQSAISSAGTTIVSVSITTNGYPVLVNVTGDVENNSAGGWTILQLYRGSTAIGNPIHTEGSAGSENVPYALSVIDAPTAGTYTYALKLNNSAGGTFNFGESDGPVISALELSGPKGDIGSNGYGVPTGGATGQVLSKINATDYNTQWVTPTDTNTTYTFAPGGSAGTISVTPSGGTATDIAVYGLGTAAYTASSAYATAGHNHSGVYEPVITSGTTAQYWRGDKSWQTLPTIPTNVSSFTNDSGYVASTGATFTGNVAINNGTSTAITTTGTIASIFNSNATTVNIGGAAATVSIGSTAHSGTTTIQNDLYVSGNITFGGGANTLSATNLEVTDSLIYLSASNTADIIDIGWIGAYKPSATHLHTGLVRDASDGIWKLFSNISAEPTTVVDFTSATYDVLKIGSIQVTDAATSLTNLGATTVGSNIFALTNPGTTSWIRMNADNTVSARSAANTKIDLSLGNVENTALSTWAGTANITTLGTIGTGTWQGSLVAGQYGGTGVANTGKTITLGGNLTTSGAFAATLTLTGTTNVTLPTSGTLMTTTGNTSGTAAALTSGNTINGVTFTGASAVKVPPTYSYTTTGGGTLTTGWIIALTGASAPTARPDGTAIAAGDIWISY